MINPRTVLFKLHDAKDVKEGEIPPTYIWLYGT
jgi:hypothetical protein